jgi:integrating conjugative element membrane protein (TIGR03747 family)
VVLGAFLLNLLMAFLGIALLWPEQGAAHSQRILLMEIGRLATALTHSPLFAEPFVTVVNGIRAVCQWTVVASGSTAWGNAQLPGPLHGDNGLSRQINLWLGEMAGYCHDYLLAAWYVSGVVLVRIGILLLVLPLFVLVVMVAVVEGLSRRDLRRYGAAYESSFVYHHARRLVKPAVCVPGTLYLAWPTTVDPSLFILPAAALLGGTVMLTLASFKKYL